MLEKRCRRLDGKKAFATRAQYGRWEGLWGGGKIIGATSHTRTATTCSPKSMIFLFAPQASGDITGKGIPGLGFISFSEVVKKTSGARELGLKRSQEPRLSC